MVDYIGYNKMVRLQGTGVLLLPSNNVDRKRDHRGHVVVRYTRKEVALRDGVRSIIGIGDGLCA